MALTGNERIIVQGVAPTGGLASVGESVTTRDIADLGGGGGAVGAAGVVQASDGSGAFQVSGYFDNLTVSGSVTVSLEDSASPDLPFPGLVIAGSDTGGVGILLVVVPQTSGGSTIEQIGFAAYPNWIMTRGSGTRQAPAAVSPGDDLGEFTWQGFIDGANVATGGGMSVIVETVDPDTGLTTSINFTNANNFGWHIAADGTFSLDKGVSTGGNIDIPGNKVFSNAGTPLIGAADSAGAQVGTLTNAPTAGNPAVFLRVRAPDGTVYAVPGWAIP